MFLIASVVAVAGVMVFGGTASAGKPKYSTPVEAILTWAAEVPSETGDDNGSGTARLLLYPAKNKICNQIRVENTTLPATAAHLHAAPAGSEGPAILGLEAPGNDGSSGMCRRGLGTKFIRKIKRNPRTTASTYTTMTSRTAP